MDHTITYRFGSADYIALIRARRSIGPFGRLGRWGRAVLFGLLFVGLLTAFSYDVLLNAPWLVLTVGAAMFVLMVLAALAGEYLGERLMARWWFPRYSVANKGVTLEFGDEGVRSTVGGIEGRVPWRAITRVFETKDFLLLALSRAEMIVVPMRALASADAFAGLARYVRTKVAAAAA
jgi:hypothetical protein